MKKFNEKFIPNCTIDKAGKNQLPEPSRTRDPKGFCHTDFMRLNNRNESIQFPKALCILDKKEVGQDPKGDQNRNKIKLNFKLYPSRTSDPNGFYHAAILLIFVVSLSLWTGKGYGQSAHLTIENQTLTNGDHIARDKIIVKEATYGQPGSGQTVRLKIDKSMVLPTSYNSNPPQQGSYQVNTSLPVGAINGTASVSPTGAANYNVPIQVPPGTAGMQPQLAIVYNSQGGNGLLGIGWELAGLSAITRVPQTVFQDLSITAVEVSNNDRFALDGNRLIKVPGSGNYGSNGCEYRTEMESFSKITSYGQAGDGPGYFEVITKDGKILEYGKADGSQVIAWSNSAQTALMWRLNKVTDMNGNYIRYIYASEEGESRIERVEYTGNDGAGVNPYCTIYFYYDRREDKNKYYMKNAVVSQTNLLRSIVIEAEGQHFKTYEFKYNYNYYTRLIEINEKGEDYTPLNPTVIYWGDEATVYNDDLLSFGISNPTFISGDFNGDGKSDLLVIAAKSSYNANDQFSIYYSNEDGNFIYSGISQVLNYDYFNPYLSRAGDINVDGTDDLLLAYQDNDETRFVPVLCYPGSIDFRNQDAKLFFDTNDCCESYSIFITDFNGDGQNEVLIAKRFYDEYSPELIRLRLYKFISNNLQHLYTFDADHAKQVNVINYNGDSKANLLIVYTDDAPGNHLGEVLEINNQLNGYSYLYHSGFPTEWHRIYTGDFNGDGKTDLLTCTDDNNNNTGSWRLNYNTGDGLNTPGFQTTFMAPLDPEPGPSSVYQYIVIVADFNGDGKDDIFESYTLINQNQTNKLHLSKGLNLFETINLPFYFSSTVNYQPGGIFISQPFSRSRISDFNGDGRVDIIVRSLGTTNSYACSILSFFPMDKKWLVKGITNGTGYESTFEYDPISKGGDLYNKGGTASGNLLKVQMPLFVVAESKSPDGRGYENIANYSYKGAILQKGGRGLLGFEEVKTTTFNTQNIQYAWHNINFFEYEEVNTQSYSNVNSFLKKTEVRKSGSGNCNGNNLNNVLISKTEYENAYTFTNQVLSSYTTETKATDQLTGIISTTTYLYNEGNVVNESTEIKKGTNITLTRTAARTFDAIGGWGIKNRLMSETIAQTYTGKPPYSRTTSYSYNNNGKLTSEIIDPSLPQPLTTTYNYTGSACGLAKSRTITAPGVTGRSESYEYDSKYRFVVKVTDAAGYETKYQYDAFGNKLTETGITGQTTLMKYDAFNRNNVVITPQGHEVKTHYKWTMQPGNNSVYEIETEAPSAPVTRVKYDIAGREIRKETDSYEGLVATDIEYDYRGKLKKEYSPSFNGVPLNGATEYFYDSYERLCRTTTAGVNADYTYNVQNLSTTITDYSGSITKINDAAGNLITSTDQAGNSVNYEYGSQGKPLLITAPGGSLTEIEYDEYGRQIKLTDPNAGITEYDYNAFGELTRQEDANGNVYEMMYDNVGRISTKTGPEGVYQYTYYSNGGGKGKLQQVTGPGGAWQAYEYDEYGRVTRFTDAMPGKAMVTEYEHDGYGNLIKKRWPSGKVINYMYDSKGYMTEMKDENGSTIWQLNTLNAREQPLQISYGNGKSTQYSYWPTTGQVTSANTSLSPSGNKLFEYEYDFNNGYRMENRKVNTQEGALIIDNFNYDNLNRLGQTVSLKFVNSSYWQLPGSTVYYQNNGTGNISIKADAGTYSYDPQKIHAVTGIEPSAGSAIATPEQEITYTAFNKAETITEGDYSYELTYGPDQQRIKSELKENGTVIKTKYYTTDYEEEITPAGTRKLHYISSPYGLVAIYIDDGVSPQMYYVLTDHLGSIRALTDGNGQIAEEYSFDSWGRRRDAQTGQYVSTFSGLTDRGYTGHEHLDEFGLINMNGRMYDPVLGRMLSPDNYVQDATGTQNYNRYSYCLNNPIAYTDPSGDFLVEAFLIGSMINVLANSGRINSVGSLLGYAFVGGITGMASAGLSSGLGASLGAIQGFSNGAITGSVGCFFLGAGNGLVSGADNPLLEGLKLALTGSLIGGAVGGVVAGVDAVNHQGNFWNGKGRITAFYTESIQEGTIKIGEGMEYSNEYVKSFSDQHFGENIEGLNNLYADGAIPQGADYYAKGDHIFDSQGNEVVGLTKYLGKSQGSDVYLYKSAFISEKRLYVTMGHEYIHVKHNYAGLLNFYKSEHAAHRWSAKQEAAFGMIPKGYVYNSKYLHPKLYDNLYDYKKFIINKIKYNLK